MQKITMSMEAFEATLQLLGCSGKHLLPDISATGAEQTDAFLCGREELCKNGWAEMDFDGKISPSREFARLIYATSHDQGVIYLELPEKNQWCLRTPVEMLWIQQEKKTVTLERQGGRAFLPWIRETVLPAPEGTITTLQKEEIRKASLAQFPASSELRARELVRHLSLFFGKEEDNA